MRDKDNETMAGPYAFDRIYHKCNFIVLNYRFLALVIIRQ